MLVKPMTRRYITEHKGKHWTGKSMDRCPICGIYEHCAGSGPSGMIYRDKQTFYRCPWTNISISCTYAKFPMHRELDL
jgi:hypothetical protein